MSTSTTSTPSGGPCASTCPSSLQAFKGAKVENAHHWKLLLPALQCRGLRWGTVLYEDQEAWTGVNAVAVSRCHTPTVSGTTKSTVPELESGVPTSPTTTSNGSIYKASAPPRSAPPDFAPRVTASSTPGTSANAHRDLPLFWWQVCVSGLSAGRRQHTPQGVPVLIAAADMAKTRYAGPAPTCFVSEHRPSRGLHNWSASADALSQDVACLSLADQLSPSVQLRSLVHFVFVHDVVTDFPDMRAQKKNRCESPKPAIENAVQRV